MKDTTKENSEDVLKRALIALKNDLMNKEDGFSDTEKRGIEIAIVKVEEALLWKKKYLHEELESSANEYSVN